jgi:NIMA-interacting peptidyl-prolyl cis-trans isomerase 1
MLPSGWTSKESKSKPGVFYYINNSTGETQWEVPTQPVTKDSVVSEVRASHILKKHNKSRRPSSWRCEVITQSKDESISQIKSIISQLEECLQTKGNEAMFDLFSEIASTESDCSSAQRGGSNFIIRLNIYFLISISMLLYDR